MACFGANKLQEYTTHGSLVREICLHGVTRPWHAIQLSTGDYVVSQYVSPDVVNVVGVDGQVTVTHSYGQSQTLDVGQMEYPPNLAVTKNDDIIVADEVNNRIMSIKRSASAGRVQELARLCLLTMEHNSHLVCVWTSHEIDSMSMNRTDNIECWSLMEFGCDIYLMSE